jgi:coenzyme F420-reducing hydrogenase delta subunit
MHMNESRHPGIAVYICHRCIPDGVRFPRQWTQEGVHVQVHELPCGGKTEAQYLFHAMEAGARGLLVITCPKGECHLAQGNYRAEVRVGTVQRLLTEIGMEPERALLARCAPGDDLDGLVRDAVSRICALGESPIRAARSTV